MVCQICSKAPRPVGIGRHLNSGKWRHRGPETKRLVYPNVQKTHGKYICTQCLKTLDKQKVAQK